MNNDRPVWSRDEGDLRKKKNQPGSLGVIESEVLLKIRRLTAGKGRTVVEITGLPKNAAWCKELARQLKSSLGVGGSFKDGFIEIHGEKLDQVTALIPALSQKGKQVGG